MTVCMAAICSYGGYPMIVGASDRKYTVGDWTYEPTQTKHYNLAPNVLVLISGDIARNLAICESTRDRLALNPTDDVGEIARLFALEYAEYRRSEAERALLFPIGLTLTTYRKERQAFVKRMDRELRQYQLSESAIVAGMSGNGTAHVYQIIDPGWAICEDASGFVTIGSGGRHAAAEFMRAKYDRSWVPARALLLTYRAKKSSEVDAFVGSETDIYIVTTGGATGLNEHLRSVVEASYEQSVTQERLIADQAMEDIEHDFNAFLNEQEEVPSTPQLESANGTGILESGDQGEQSPNENKDSSED